MKVLVYQILWVIVCSLFATSITSCNSVDSSVNPVNAKEPTVYYHTASCESILSLIGDNGNVTGTPDLVIIGQIITSSDSSYKSIDTLEDGWISVCNYQINKYEIEVVEVKSGTFEQDRFCISTVSVYRYRHSKPEPQVINATGDTIYSANMQEGFSHTSKNIQIPMGTTCELFFRNNDSKALWKITGYSPVH